jgi:hypothetical protein
MGTPSTGYPQDHAAFCHADSRALGDVNEELLILRVRSPTACPAAAPHYLGVGEWPLATFMLEELSAPEEEATLALPSVG